MSNPIKHLLLAVQFFTRIPITGRLAAWVGFSPEMLRAGAGYFPAVGWIVALVACVVYWAGYVVFNPLIAAILCTIATVMLTGAFHEDGLADLVDGLGAGGDRDRMLTVMKDSRVGAFGAIALVLTLMLKIAVLEQLGSTNEFVAMSALLVAHVVTRFFPLLAIRWLPHIGNTDTSKSKPLADAITWGSIAIGVLWCVPPLVGGLLLTGVWINGWAMVACVIGFIWMLRLFQRRLGGFTGDCLGAMQQICEVAFYLGAAASLRFIP